MSAALWMVCAGAAVAQAPEATPIAVSNEAASNEPVLELLGGPDGDQPQGVQAAMAPTAPAAIVGSHAASAVEAARRETPTRPRAPLGMSGPAGAVGLSMGMGLCWQAQGAPDETTGPASALVLAHCDGRDTQRLRLEDGVLVVGNLGAHAVRPLAAPARGCATQAVETATRAYEFKLCAGVGALVVEDVAPGRTRITAFAQAGAPAYVRGAPLVVDFAAAGEAQGVRFEYVRRGKLVRVVGTDLCVSPPVGDVSEQAPLFLDSCAAPSSGDPTHLRATYVMSWR